MVEFEKKIIRQEQIELTTLMPSPPSLIHYWNYVILQFGYMSFFSLVFPLGALWGAFIGIIHINIQYYLFCNQIKRPLALERSSIGIWKSFLEAYALIGLFIGGSILMFTSQSVYMLLKEGATDFKVAVTLFFTQIVILIVKFGLEKFVDDVPGWVAEQKRIEKLRKDISNENSKIKYLNLKREVRMSGISSPASVYSADGEGPKRNYNPVVSSPLKAAQTFNLN